MRLVRNITFVLIAIGTFHYAALAQGCPRAYNTQVPCHSTGCQGMAQQGYCRAPYDQNQFCERDYTICCGNKVYFTQPYDDCLYTPGEACGKPSERVVGRLIDFPPIDKHHLRIALVSALHKEAGAGVTARSSHSAAAF
jgi:hypothetical protein